MLYFCFFIMFFCFFYVYLDEVLSIVITLPFKVFHLWSSGKYNQPFANSCNSSHCIKKRKYIYFCNACSFSKCVVLNSRQNTYFRNLLSRFNFLSEPMFGQQIVSICFSFSIWNKKENVNIFIYLNKDIQVGSQA